MNPDRLYRQLRWAKAGPLLTIHLRRVGDGRPASLVFKQLDAHTGLAIHTPHRPPLKRWWGATHWLPTHLPTSTGTHPCKTRLETLTPDLLIDLDLMTEWLKEAAWPAWCRGGVGPEWKPRQPQRNNNPYNKRKS